MPSRKPSRKIGYAVVGLGHVTQKYVLPAFANARNSRLVALVSGDERKLRTLSKKYRVPQTYSYDDFDDCLANQEVDAVFIALPNHLHEAYAVRAARAGVHVLCEKPLALSERSCRNIIRACDESFVKLMTAYRLQLEPSHQQALQRVRKGVLGELRFYTAEFSFAVKKGNIRAKAQTGGGPLWDIGIYCINHARAFFNAEPEEVFAFAVEGDPDRFEGVEQAMSCQLRFPDGRLASFTVSFDATDSCAYRLVGTQGELRVEKAYELNDKRTQVLTAKGRTTRKTFQPSDQFGPELVYFSNCILRDEEVTPDGWEGLADARVIEALHRSAVLGHPVPLAPFARPKRPSQERGIRLPKRSEAARVNVQAPHD